MCRNTSGKLEKLFNHLYRIYGILVHIHALDRNQTHKHEGRIIYGRIGACGSPDKKKPTHGEMIWAYKLRTLEGHSETTAVSRSNHAYLFVNFL